MYMDCWPRKMSVHIIIKLTLFHMLVAWCGAKVIMNDHRVPRVETLTEDDVQDSIRDLIHNGIYSHRHLDSSQVQVTTPVKVSHDGELISYELRHDHEHGHARARRDLFHTEHKIPHTLHYNLTVDGRELRMDLRPSVTFITPALVVERRREGVHSRSKPDVSSTSCHYTGTVRGQPASKVAISACDGLAGLLRTEHGEYWIEPSNQGVQDVFKGRPHVIFKRSAVDKVAAHNRAKRSLEQNTNRRETSNKPQTQRQYPRRYQNDPRFRETKESRDRRRRLYLGERRRQMETLRNNPTEYRAQKSVLRMEQRRPLTYPRLTNTNPRSSSVQTNTKSHSIETSKSYEQSSYNNKRYRNNRNKSRNERKQRRKNRRRRRKRDKNCATIQPPYQWNTTKNTFSKEEYHRNNKKYRRNHRTNLSWRQAGFDSKRPTRSVSKPRHVEVLLVADKSMTDFHRDNNLETYLLTIMNMVSSLYMDPTIGNYIKVVVVKIILIENNEDPELNVSINADTTLSSFCQWQMKQNPENDTNPYHHDVAILVTRQDICSVHDIPCSTLGVAHVAGMCKPDRSCSVNEDNGIMLAHTITHELGHNFGLYHDTEKIGCHAREGSTLHIMTPYFESDTVLVAWSTCSKRDVTMFLDAGMGDCLADRPSQEEYVYPKELAGVTFDATTQCHLQFGVEADVCSEPGQMCEILWCYINSTCKSMLRPPAPGTTCGPDMWCQNLECVPRAPSPEPRDGGWGPWSAWSECSRTCGAGVSVQSRECNNPKPNNNGAYCIGDRSRYKICNTEPCPINEPTFREVQCSRFNNITFNNETIAEWVPYYDQDKPCELQCLPRSNEEDEGAIGGLVLDGTPCRQNPAARDMCIAGVCYKVGCDWKVNSDMEHDACGVCGGDGSACKTVQGIYTKGTTKQTGFSEVAVIPAGSRNVKIQEKVNPGNYLSIGSAKTKKFYLYGAKNATLTEYFVAGSQAIYERDRDWEKVRIPGPIAEDIKVYQRIYRGKHRNPGVTYQYTVDKKRSSRRFHYVLSDWSPCSVTCGDGQTRRYHQCVDQKLRVVPQSRCYHIESPRNEALIQRCRLAACPSTSLTVPSTHWWVGAWNPCSKSCHMQGQQATKHRSVYCVDKTSNKVVNDSVCDPITRPMNTIICADVPAC